jgi:hypothetical protein
MPEVTGSIPVRSISCRKADLGRNARKIGQFCYRRRPILLPTETVPSGTDVGRFRPYAHGLGKVPTVWARSSRTVAPTFFFWDP